MKRYIVLAVLFFLAIVLVAQVCQKRADPPVATDSTGKQAVTVKGQEVWYREKGAGTPILILVGWGGPADPYFPFQDELADKGYRVFLPDLPGLPGKTPSTYIPAHEWSSWVDEFAQAAIGEPFFIFSHSLSAQISIRYVSEEESRAAGLILLSPWLVPSSQENFWRFASGVVRTLAPFVYQEMSWVRDEAAWATARELISPFQGQPEVPCLILWGKRDLLQYIAAGWRETDCEVKRQDWAHSPQIRSTAELADVIDEFVRSKTGQQSYLLQPHKQP